MYPELSENGEKDEGYLLYIKSSFSGNEDETMQEYRAKNPAFPHESTADQFFDEGQFEAYRALGFHMADGLFPPRQWDSEKREWDPKKMGWTAFKNWFGELEADLAPRLSAKHVTLQKQLRKIAKLLQRPEYRKYFYEMHPQLGEGRTEEEKSADLQTQATMPQITYLVELQLDLMENAFLSLNLDQPVNWNHPGNEGWRTLFKTWADGSEDFVRGFCFLRHLRSGRFLNFCERRLKLPTDEGCKVLRGEVEPAGSG